MYWADKENGDIENLVGSLVIVASPEVEIRENPNFSRKL